MTDHLKDFRAEDLEETADQLQEIQEQLLELLGQADELLSNSAPAEIYSSASAYWLANSKCEFSNDHNYLSRGSMTNLPETIAALRRDAILAGLQKELAAGKIDDYEYEAGSHRANDEFDQACQ